MLEIVFVTGTGTEVGKTWVAARLLENLRTGGVPVAARKPVQSFDPEGPPPDSAILAAATGEAPEAVCRDERSYPVPLAPPMAARVLGLPPFSIAELRSELVLPESGVVVIEGAGGPRSPIAADGDSIALSDAVGATTVVLVSEPGLGTINSVTLCLEALAPRPAIVFLNRFAASEQTHSLNRDWLAAAGVDVVTSIPELSARVSPDPGRDG